jgi:hypothetical protein
MKTLESLPADIGRAGSITDPLLDAALLYDSIESARRAAQLIASLGRCNGSCVVINLSPLSFSILGEAALSALATTDGP